MSVSFFLPHRDDSINLSNRNACDLLRWLGYALEALCPYDLVGELDAGDLAARCRRRLWPQARNDDPVREARWIAPNALECGRAAGYLRGRTAELLALAALAGYGVVRFG